MLDANTITKALELRRAVWEEYDGLRYVRFADGFQGVCRGTAVFDNCVVYGYPSIGRLMSLQPGLRHQFNGPFWMEEKIDGFNVRAFRLNDGIFALTRGGFICPFTTDRIADFIDDSVFAREPGIVLCGEVAGPDNPYMGGSVPYIKEDVRFFVFDIGAVNQRQFAPYREKQATIGRYQLPPVPAFGRFELTDLPAIREILSRLNDEYREGVIFKEDSSRDHRAKYTTANINILDIESGAYIMFDLPPEYFINRLARLALFMEDQGIENHPLLQQRLGAAYMKGLLEALRQVRQNHKVVRTFRCRFRRRENAARMLERLKGIGNHVQITVHELAQEASGYWRLEFDKAFPKSSGMLGGSLTGSLLFD